MEKLSDEDELDWARQMAGECRAWYEEHRPAFDKLSEAQKRIEELKRDLQTAVEAHNKVVDKLTETDCELTRVMVELKKAHTENAELRKDAGRYAHAREHLAALCGCSADGIDEKMDDDISADMQGGEEGE